jgi:hypothetical protein
MSALSFVLLSGSSLVFFLIPLFTQMAETGQQILKAGAIRILPVVAGAIRFMFMGGRVRPDPASGSPKAAEGWRFLSSDGWWALHLEKILRWGIEAAAVAFLVIVAAAIIFLALKWLFSRTAVIPRSFVNCDTSLSWFSRVRAFFAAFWWAVMKLTRGYTRAAELYAVLSEWGRRSGLPRRMTDTPLEFGARLVYQFPKLKAEIGSIVAAFNKETYRETRLTDEQFTRALLSWRAMRNPVHWPRRLKMRLAGRMLSEG